MYSSTCRSYLLSVTDHWHGGAVNGSARNRFSAHSDFGSGLQCTRSANIVIGSL